MGSVPPVDSIRISDQIIPVEIATDATCPIEILSSLLPNSRDFTRLTRSGPTTMRVGKNKFPFVQRLAENVCSPPGPPDTVAVITVCYLCSALTPAFPYENESLSNRPDVGNRRPTPT